jgi:hypothetical protein
MGKDAEKMKTPYTTKTGLKIGKFYEPPREIPHPDRDAAKLQRALLDEPTPNDWDGVAIVLSCLCIAIVSWMLA